MPASMEVCLGCIAFSTLRTAEARSTCMSSVPVIRGEPCCLTDTLETAQVLLRPQCCLVVSGDEAYRRCQHSIRDQAADLVTAACANRDAAQAAVGDVIARSARRVSLVFVTKLSQTA